MTTVYIVSCARTPIGSFRGSLSSLKASELGSIAIREAVDRSGVSPKDIDEVFMGHVIQAGCGQNSARQAALGAGIPVTVPCSTINKVCASGMKAISVAAASIRSGDNQLVVAGGMESMSNAPYYLKRGETPYGGVTLIDGLVNDGLTDAATGSHMGDCAEQVAERYKITREEQDAYAAESYKRSAVAWKEQRYANEVVPVRIAGKRPGAPETVVSVDEEFTKVDFEKMKKLRTVFKQNGTITAANASTLNDGAAACVLATEAAVKKFGLKPIAKIIACADAATETVDFPIAPAFALPKVLERANIKIEDISLIEVNEAFSLVTLANIKLSNFDKTKVNVNGGAVSLGHPLGMSGARIVNTLALHLKSGDYGLAGVCNGGGGATAVIVQRI